MTLCLDLVTVHQAGQDLDANKDVLMEHTDRTVKRLATAKMVALVTL